MKLFFPQKPANVVAITTNSSSEIFVMGENEDMNQVDKLIKVGGWEWWFGERKQITTENVAEFAEKYSHVLSDLFPEYHDIPQNPYSLDNPCFRWNGSEFVPEVLHVSPKLRALKEKHKGLPWDIGHYDAEHNQHVEDLQGYFATKGYGPMIGSYYYECGEDNELNDWDLVHDTIPGKYARLS